MNVRHTIVENSVQKPPKFLHVSFNQDDSCFSTSTEDGFLIYNTDPLSCKLTKRFEQQDDSRSGAGAGIGYTRMLYRTNYTALVGGGKRPRYPLNKLIIWDDLQQRESIVLKFMSPVKQVFLSRIHIVSVLDSSIEVFQFQPNPKRICPSLEIFPNGPVDFVVSQLHRKNSQEPTDSTGASSNSSTGINGMLAFPSARSIGQVHIADFSRLKHNDQNPEGTQLLPTSIIKAHKTPIRFLRLNHQGTMVATCSIQGTLIRIFSTHNGSLIKEFRRGLDRADVYDMAFSPKGTRLAVVSDKRTLHVFQISLKEVHAGPGANDETSKNKLHALKNVVPSGWKPKYLDSVWSMCSVHLKNPTLKRSGVEPQYQQDRCKIGWCRDSGDHGTEFDEEDSIVLVWRKTGIWEKYVILEKEQQQMYSAQETLKTDTGKGSKTQWELVRESWREL
ncbi:probable SVP1-like protein 2 [Zygosaccharomyces bailii]|nr:probable SVP1-like protein 2 [Zygosaccharomyces bailii]